MRDGTTIAEAKLTVQIEPLLVRRTDAAKLLAISTRVFDDLVRAGLIGKTKIGGSVLFDVEELRAFARQAKVDDYTATTIAALVAQTRPTRSGWRGRPADPATDDA